MESKKLHRYEAFMALRESRNWYETPEEFASNKAKETLGPVVPMNPEVEKFLQWLDDDSKPKSQDLVNNDRLRYKQCHRLEYWFDNSGEAIGLDSDSNMSVLIDVDMTVSYSPRDHGSYDRAPEGGDQSSSFKILDVHVMDPMGDYVNVYDNPVAMKYANGEVELYLDKYDGDAF